jgi:monoamine oxidase
MFMTKSSRKKVSKTANAGKSGSGGAKRGATPFPAEADCCVIGAGYAGLSAAYFLTQAKKTVTVLEAGPRIGGRIWSEKLSDGTPVDLGGAWVSKSQKGIWKMVHDLNVPIYQQIQKGKSTFLRKDGKVFHYQEIPDLMDPDGAGPEVMADLGATLAQFEGMAAALDPRTPWKPVELPFLGPGKTTRDADAISFGVWLDNVMVTELGKAMLGGTLCAIHAVDPATVSLLQAINQIATSPQRTLQQFVGDKPGEAESHRVVGGAGEIGKAMAKSFADRIVLNAPVTLIRYTRDAVEVVSDQGTVRAKRVILAIPVALLNTIRFDPPLPENRAQLHQRIPGGALWKFWLVYDEPFWRKEDPALNGVSLAPYSVAPITYDAGLAEGVPGPGLLNVFVVADAARRLAQMKPADRMKLIVKEMTARFGPKAARLSKKIVHPRFNLPYVEQNWTAEPWVRGSFVGMAGPGVLGSPYFGPSLRAPVGPIHWAGGDTATRWYGTMDGALQSGDRASAEVLKEL